MSLYDYSGVCACATVRVCVCLSCSNVLFRFVHFLSLQSFCAIYGLILALPILINIFNEQIILIFIFLSSYLLLFL